MADDQMNRWVDDIKKFARAIVAPAKPCETDDVLEKHKQNQNRLRDELEELSKVLRNGHDRAA